MDGMSVTAEEIHDLVAKYLAEYPDEVGRLARLSEALRAPHEPNGHLTSAAVLIDPHWRVLHLRYRQWGRWLLPETHLTAADDSLASAALRGLYERLGIEPEMVTPLAGFEVTPIDIDIHRRSASRAPRHGAHWHFEVRHAFQISGTPTIVLDRSDPAEPTWLGYDEIPGFALRLKLQALQRSALEDTGN
jgi:8-oxo-dGTP pyrophosphatase MutT (NUDIX family)